MKKPRNIGKILLDLEVLLNELCDQGLQWGDILYLIYGWLVIHRPDAQEEYTDGGSPKFFYGYKKED